MTSTSINVGLTSEKKPSSRVLRPPGGGESDVLGLGGAAPMNGPKKGNPRNTSSILEGTNTNMEAPKSPVKAAPKAPTLIEPPKAQADDPAVQRRARVPPGGFSSGLW